MKYVELPVKPLGLWSPVQARKVCAIINPIALRFGILFEAVDVSTHNVPQRVMLVGYCTTHDIAVVPDAVCQLCAMNVVAWKDIEQWSFSKRQ